MPRQLAFEQVELVELTQTVDDGHAAGGTAELAGTSGTTTVSVVELGPLTASVTYEFWLVDRNSQGEGPQSNHVSHVAT